VSTVFIVEWGIFFSLCRIGVDGIGEVECVLVCPLYCMLVVCGVSVL